MNPRLRNDIHYCTKDGKHLFLSPSVPDWLVVNESAAAVLGLCDGTRSTAEIAESLRVRHMQGEIAGLLARASSHGLLDDGKAGPDEPGAGRDRAGVRGDGAAIPLRTVHIQLTNRCNYRCSYCYAASGTQRHPLLPLEILTQLVDDIVGLSPRCRYELSGGEPLLHPAALDLAEYIARKGGAVSLLTNGSLVSERNARRIAALFDFVKISLDGPTAATNARTRGKGTFKKTRRAIDLLRSAGANVGIAMTVTRQNLDLVADMVREFGSALTFAPVFPAGRGTGNEDLCITGAEYYHALASIPGVNPLSSLNGVIERGRGRRSLRCAMAESEVSIADDGGVYPCQLLHEPEFCAGNIRVQSVRQIYDSDRFRELRKVNVFSIAECGSCPIRHLCAGACRARSHYECGSIHVSGEFCEYEKLAYVNGLLDAAVI